jgi:putative transposase
MAPFRLKRQHLHHDVPKWVEDGSLFFVTICARPRMENQLCRPGIAEALINSARVYHELRRWWLKLFLLMPDHLHAIIGVPRPESLGASLRVWKSYQSKYAGVVWQDGFFDHRLRTSESADKKAHYIRMNPVRAGLVAEPGLWPHFWPKPANFSE